MEILFDNSTEFEIDRELIKKVAAKVLETEGVKGDAEISFTAVTLDEIHDINKKHRGIDRPTDVLSFPLINFETEKLPQEGKIYLGDIILCPERALEQSKEYGHSFEREIAFLTAHSMLHLLGYDHMEVDEEKIMFGKQEEVLKQLNINR